jgi:hypothetical protein
MQENVVLSRSEIETLVAYQANLMHSLIPIWALVAIVTLGVFLA